MTAPASSSDVSWCRKREEDELTLIGFLDRAVKFWYLDNMMNRVWIHAKFTWWNCRRMNKN